MSEAGVAWVTLVPTMRGFSGDVSKTLTRGLTKPLKRAGNDAGDALATGIKKGADDGGGRIKSTVSKIGDLFKTGLKLAGIAAGALLVTGLLSALDTQAATDKLVAQLGGGEFAEEMGGIAGKLYGQAFGESVADTGEAVRKVLQSGLLPEDATNKQIERMSAKALTFADVLDRDMGMAIQAVERMLRTGLAGSADQAFDVLTRGVQQGADSSGDLLETFQEYSTVFRELGISAEDATGLMIQGLKGGARDADKVADALKEVAIRAQDGSKKSAEGFALIGLNADEMTAKFASGGEAAREGLGQVLTGLRNIEDPVARNAAAVALFGTQAEDLGDALFNLDLDSAAAAMGETEGATDKLSEAYNNASTRVEAFKRQALQKLVTFLGNTLIPMGERVAQVLGPVLGAAIRGIQDLVARIDFDAVSAQFNRLTAAIDPVLDAIRPAVDYLLANEELLVGALAGVAAVIVGVLVPALIALAVPMIAAAAPFLAVAAAAAALGAGLVWLYNNVDEFRAFVDKALPLVGAMFVGTFQLILTVITGVVEAATAIWRRFGDDIVAVAKAAWALVAGVVTGAVDVLIGTIRVFAAIFRGDWTAVWDGVKQILRGAWRIILSIVRAHTQLMQGILRAAWGAVKALFRLGSSAVSSIWRTLWNNVTRWVRSAWTSIVSGVSGGINRMVGALRAVRGKIISATSGMWNPIVDQFRKVINKIKSLWSKLNLRIPKIKIPGLGSVGGGSIARSITRRLPFFASGNVARSATLGVFGEYPGASRDPEITAPESLMAKTFRQVLEEMRPDPPALLPAPAAPLSAAVFTDRPTPPVAPTARAASTDPLAVTVSGDGLPAALLEWLRYAVRVEGGGDVQAALGQL